MRQALRKHLGEHAGRAVRTALAALVVAAFPAAARAGVEAAPVQLASAAGATAAAPEVVATPERIVARIDLSDQAMTVYVDGKIAHRFKVSTGRGSYRTPTGRWNAAWLSPRHRSRKYNNAPMPWSVFFYNGYAVHGTTEVKRLGRPASHGCVRLHPDNAKVFFALVKDAGLDNSLISIVR